MSTEENIALVRRHVDEINNRNLAAAAECMTPDYVDHSDPPGTPPGPEPAIQRVQWFLAAFPDFQVTLEDVVAAGDKVVTYFVARGTHQGALMGIPPTGKQIEVRGMDINRLADGKMRERWAVLDQFGLLQQLGAIPTPGQG